MRASLRGRLLMVNLSRRSRPLTSLGEMSGTAMLRHPFSLASVRLRVPQPYGV